MLGKRDSGSTSNVGREFITRYYNSNRHLERIEGAKFNLVHINHSYNFVQPHKKGVSTLISFGKDNGSRGKTAIKTMDKLRAVSKSINIFTNPACASRD